MIWEMLTLDYLASLDFTIQNHVVDLDRGLDRTIVENHLRDIAGEAVYQKDLLMAAQPFVLTPDAVDYCRSFISSEIDLSDFYSSIDYPQDLIWVEYAVDTQNHDENIETILHDLLKEEYEADITPSIGHLIDARDRKNIIIYEYNSNANNTVTSYADFAYEINTTTKEISVRLLSIHDFTSAEENKQDIAHFKYAANSYLKIPYVLLALLSNSENGLENNAAFSRPRLRQFKKQAEKQEIKNFLSPRKISLTKLGYGHMKAHNNTSPSVSDGTKKRAHWVRGHFMKTGEDRLSWRKPHVRGGRDGEDLPTSPILVQK